MNFVELYLHILARRKVLWEKLREHKLDGRGVDGDASDEERESST